MELYILDEERTNEDLVLNSKAEDIEISCENRNKIKEHVNLGLEPTILNIGGYYVTSKNNAADYTEMYGWHFSKLENVEM